MKRLLVLLSLFAVLQPLAAARGEARVYPYRWVYVSYENLGDEGTGKIRRIAEEAAQHGLNGMVLSGPTERLDLDSPYAFKIVNEIVRIAGQYGLELIPQVMNVGYNAFMLTHDKNLAEGLPVKDALFIAGAAEARHVPDPAVGLVNGGFEQSGDGRVVGFSFPDEDVQVAFVDNEVFKEGSASLRFENFGKQRDDGRLIQEIEVKPYRLYRISFWVKTEGLNPSDPFGSGRFRVEALGDGERRLCFFDPQVPGTTGWIKVQAGFNSKSYQKVAVSLGVWGGKTGRFWLDGLEVEEVGLVNLLRRPGTPLVVKDEQSGAVYQEGRDFERVEDLMLNFLFDHDGPGIKLLPGGRIKEGTRLRVSYYQGTAIYQGQTPICMSEPAVYEIWRRQARIYRQVFKTDKYFLNADEIRVAASCEACRSRGLSAAQILGDCVTRQARIIREINPGAELFIWSDMFDPSHNANKRDYYYLVDEDFYGAWEYIPRDLNIVCWYHGKRDQSLAHFSGLGFKTLAAAYYDADNLDNVATWLESLDKTEGAVGIMYTTWLNKYGLLGKFGDMVSQRGKKK
ncbi:MAG: hypothetical protein JXQ83_02465 [Candidatus Glassbacteria bacterium]|nr:hypothetical protein [Candidatus Glassbacteria bacterium]